MSRSSTAMSWALRAQPHAPMLEAARFVGVSKTAYVPATGRCLQWRHDLRQRSTSRRSAGRRRGDLGSRRLPAVGVVARGVADRRASRLAVTRAGRVLHRGRSRIEVGPNQHPGPIASVAKVMTAYLVLRDHPLRRGQAGPTIVLTAADVADTDRRRPGALGCRLGSPVRQAPERDGPGARHEPHALHRPERVRPSNRLDGRRPCASSSRPCACRVRTYRGGDERIASRRRRRPQHHEGQPNDDHGCRAGSAGQRQDRRGPRDRGAHRRRRQRRSRRAGSPAGRWSQ